MKEHLNKLEEKINFYVVKRLISLVIIIVVVMCTKVIILSDDGYDIKRNEYIDIKSIVDGILNITYNSDDDLDRCVIYIVNNDTDTKTRYKYILEPNKNYIITLTEGIGDYTIETLSVKDNKVYYGDNIIVSVEDVPKYIYKVPTSDINYNKALNEIELTFKNIDNIDEIAKEISDFKYDNTFAYNVKNGNIQTYTPDIKRFLNERVGICLDAATALTAVYRYKGYEAQLVYGYIEGNNEYHSWVRVLHNGEWITFDPTLCKGNRVENVDKYIISEYH